ncbi:hypothetical protein LCGC14_0271030 [marine sediment metagenome]|jgi:uncharacterized protein (UPF0335 family)|uniref:GapR-like DNA-binding domain-containing protein n=1 Tax=marine sediment metagenome TaxID=412755 RepID=A0A0F9U3Q8_9ZZZZ
MADENEDNGTTRIEGRQLTAFIERRERLAIEKKDVAEQEKELNSEIKNAGYDLKYVNHCIKERAKDADKRDNERAEREAYEAAVGLS